MENTSGFGRWTELVWTGQDNKYAPWLVMSVLLLVVIIIDQVRYQTNKGSLAGPAVKLPIIGSFLESMHPNFNNYLAKWDSGPLSCVSIFHKFVVIASARDLARKAFNSPTYLKPTVVDIAPKLLGEDNWVFLDGKAHVDYRKGLNMLFNKKSISIYLPGQEEIYDNYLHLFEKMSKDGPVPYAAVIREMNCATSCRTFVGNYLDEETVKMISQEFYSVTAALELVNFPIILPFTKAWYGRKSANKIMKIFTDCAAKSRVNVESDGPITCTMDEWLKQIIEAKRHAEEKSSESGPRRLREFSDREIAQTIFTFLFASQDATSSAVTFLLQMVADRRDVMEKIHAEQLQVRGGDINVPLSIELLETMPYTRAVVKELLRYRPPVIMVPYIVKKPFPITPDYTVPKGAMVIPSTYPALHDAEAYPDPESFIPERWLDGGTAEAATKNWLVFGLGTHHCLGQVYAVLHLMAFIGKAAMLYDWKHKVTPLSNEVTVFATLFPSDNLYLQFFKRDLAAVS